MSEFVNQAYALCERFNFPTSDFNAVAIDLTTFSECESWRGNHLAYARIFAIGSLKEEFLFYLDSDTLVLKDIRSLVPALSKDFICAAVRDETIESQTQGGYHLDGKPCVDSAPYFNSGVLVINRSQCEKFQMLNKFYAIVPRLSNAKHGDQSYLNAILRNAWTPIPEQWNRFSTRKRPVAVFSKSQPTGIIHFASSKKPWIHPTLDTSNILWHSIASSIGLSLSKEVTNNLDHQMRTDRSLRRTGLSYLERMYYTLIRQSGKRRRLYVLRSMYLNEFSEIGPWLDRHGFKPVPSSLRP